jgi:hypothetical protein
MAQHCTINIEKWRVSKFLAGLGGSCVVPAGCGCDWQYEWQAFKPSVIKLTTKRCRSLAEKPLTRESLAIYLHQSFKRNRHHEVVMKDELLRRP